MASFTKLLQFKYLAGLLLVISSCIFFGCTKYGPVFLQSERSQYNQAIQKTNDEQLLLNLVRLKYHDTPLFMEVHNIASQFTLQKDMGISTQLQAVRGFLLQVLVPLWKKAQPSVILHYTGRTSCRVS